MRAPAIAKPVESVEPCRRAVERERGGGVTSQPAAAVASLARQSIVARTRCRLFCDVDTLTRFCVCCWFAHCAVWLFCALVLFVVVIFAYGNIHPENSPSNLTLTF